jgi:hypothetical protein
MSTELADYFCAQADWRDRKAAQYPEDERNVQSAAALRSLAEYVEPIDSREAESPAGKRILSFVHELEAHLHEGMILGGERARREVTRYGYGHPVGSHEQFLEDLLLLCIEDAYDHAVEHGDDPTDALHLFELKAARDGIYIQRGYWRRRARSTVAEREKWVREARAADRDSGEGLELPEMGELLDLDSDTLTRDQALALVNDHIGEPVYVGLRMVGSEGGSYKVFVFQGDLQHQPLSGIGSTHPLAATLRENFAVYMVGDHFLGLPPLPGTIRENENGLDFELTDGLILRVQWQASGEGE